MIETVVHESVLKCPAHKFFNLFAHNMIDLPNSMPGSYKDGKILEGDGKSVGTIRQWSYVLGDNPDKVYIVKEKLEELDYEKMCLTMRVQEGSDLLEDFKSFVVTLSVTPTNDGGSLVKWTIEFEKRHDNYPHPINLYLDLFALKSSHYDTHLHKPDDE